MRFALAIDFPLPLRRPEAEPARKQPVRPFEAAPEPEPVPVPAYLPEELDQRVRLLGEW